MTTIQLTVDAQELIYLGQPQGVTEYHSRVRLDGNLSTAARACSAVLGRGSSAAAAVADWNRRARLDGFSVTGTT